MRRLFTTGLFCIVAIGAVFTLSAKEVYTSFEIDFDKDPISYAASDTMQVKVKVDRNGITNKLFYTWTVRDTVDMKDLATSTGPNRRKPVLLPLPDDDAFSFEFAPKRPCAVKLIVRTVYENNQGGAGEEVGYAVFGRDDLRPLGTKPADYDAHWEKIMRELAAEPVRFSQITRIEEGVDEAHEMFDVRIPCPSGANVSGILAYPKGAKKGTLPATVVYYGYCVEGVYTTTLNDYIKKDPARIWFVVNAHGIDNNRESKYYQALEKGELHNYGFDPKKGAEPKRNDNPDTTYFRGMMMRAIRAAESIAALPQWNGVDLEVQGGSQGGLQALTVAAYNPAVTEVSLIKPWFADFGVRSTFRPALDTGLPYYDIVNHASRVRAPLRMTVGIYDEICPMQGLISFFNVLDCDKTVYFKKAGHSALDEFNGYQTNSVPVGRLHPIREYPRAKVAEPFVPPPCSSPASAAPSSDLSPDARKAAEREARRNAWKLPTPKMETYPELAPPPPDCGGSLYLAVELTKELTKPIFYNRESDVPGGVTNIRWKTDWMLLRRIPAGIFEREDCTARIRVSKPFYIGVYEVTQQQWEHVAGRDYLPASHPSRFTHPKFWRTRPVENVVWRDVRGSEEKPIKDSFFGILNKRVGGKVMFDLPSECQWERACGRAAPVGRVMETGGCAIHEDGDLSLLLEDATYLVGAETGTAPVGIYKPNEFGLYDMLGNVLEWCRDGWQARRELPDHFLRGDGDDVAPFAGRIAARGGAWCLPASHATSWYRLDSAEMRPRLSFAYAGFRVMGTLVEE